MTPEEHPDGNQNTPEATHNQYNTWSYLTLTNNKNIMIHYVTLSCVSYVGRHPKIANDMPASYF